MIPLIWWERFFDVIFWNMSTRKTYNEDTLNFIITLKLKFFYIGFVSYKAFICYSLFKENIYYLHYYHDMNVFYSAISSDKSTKICHKLLTNGPIRWLGLIKVGINRSINGFIYHRALFDIWLARMTVINKQLIERKAM